jgi:transglutaminase-like putative cysteine protease
VRAGENHVRVAVGRDYRDAAPTRGVYVGAARGQLDVRVEVRQL